MATAGGGEECAGATRVTFYGYDDCLELRATRAPGPAHQSSLLGGWGWAAASMHPRP